MSTLVNMAGLTKRFGQLTAVNNLNLTIPSGKIIGLLGPNGSGKTTLIKMIAGLLTPSSGMLLVDNKPVGPQTKAIISYLPDRDFLDKSMTIKDTLDLYCDFYPDFDVNRANDMIKRLSLDISKPLRTLSKGTKEKVGLLLTMSRRAKLYLLDEPIAGVDPAAREYILSTIIANYDPEASVIISTHLISDVESVLDDYIFIRNGSVFMAGSVDSAREAYSKSLDGVFREVFRC